ncbi:MAG: UDP-N-acetylmuramate--L-alanine ligase [Gammaproteobacteria bacterium CG11_big_fil_rev_8_21_14_0_20_46_22]|nr:MAG: UDP-N-acetylmuramate--L-alanine ligase [Gammaproteobacteria bacterium CG12_big_fil_rev_8_21_14_0_65_46_12]PIR10810.1 MAG: UDP-N-acetylmuramate--L-alanine ligase [Gammaproteobacteria bacterium CG11_big_fil_rev_8_21_14_0_20_46_22]
MNHFKTLLGAPGCERIKRIHFVGIGGSGMCGIAQVLLNEGYQISGSDQRAGDAVHALSAQGAVIHIGHKAENVHGADVVVQSTAIAHDNVEIQTARDLRIPIVRRAEMLAELMRSRYGIAIAGTHGKTTTTSLVATVLAEGGMDPTFVIGGKLNSAGANAGLGQSRYMVTEADESDASFLHLLPMMTVVTNIDEDHMDTYGGDMAKLEQTFLDFLHHLPFYGLAILCIEDKGVRDVIARVARPTLTYGLSNQADVYATDIHYENGLTCFTVHRKDREPLNVQFSMPGRHNVLNALAAIVVGTELGVSDEAMVRALTQFSGVGRRFQRLGRFDFGRGMVDMVDEYAHHPRELAATIAAARSAYPDKRLVMAFQPHRFTRTRDLFNDFVDVLSTVDELLLLNVYTAGETVIEGANSDALASVIADKNAGFKLRRITSKDALFDELSSVVGEGDLLILAGAGDIGLCSVRLANLAETVNA